MDDRTQARLNALIGQPASRRAVLRTTAIAAGAVVAAPVLRAGTVTAQSGTAITIGQPSPFQFMDPQRTYLSSESSTHMSIFDTLVAFDDEAQFIPGLATEWEASGEREWTFTLREGVTFHNGEPFNAEVVRWNVERITEEGFQDWAFMDPVDHAEVVDEYTVKLITKDVFPTLPNLMAQFFIISPTAMENGVEAFVQQPIGTGPYTFVDWIPDDHVTVTANPDYWGGAPAITDVTWRVLPEGSTRVAALQAEEIQVLVDLPSEQFEALNQGSSRATEVRSVRTPYFRFFPESPQGGGEPFADIRVRQAVNHAVNVDSIITNLLGGHAERFPTIMTPDMYGFDPSVEPYAYDVERAKALMEEAGYADGFDVTMDTWSAGPAPKPVELAQAVAADLAQIGIRSTVNPVELGTALQNQNERTIAPFGLWSWGGNGFDGDTKFWGVFHTDSSACFLTDDETVALIDQERDTTDQEERAAIFAQLQQHVVDQAFILPMFAMMNMYGVSNTIEWTPRPDELVLPYRMTIMP